MFSPCGKPTRPAFGCFCWFLDEDVIASATNLNRISQTADIVHRQLLCKQRLCVELENDRQRLQRMQHEIQTLCAPIPAGGASRLAADIERLQSSCKLMVQQVEEAGPYGM